MYPVSPFVVAVEMYDGLGWSLEYWCDRGRIGGGGVE